MRTLGARYALCAAVAASAAAGCSSSAKPPAAAGSDGGTSASAEDSSVSCPPGPQSCPSIVPSYAREVAPILRTYCVTCHGPDGGAASDETTYADVSAQIDAIADEVESCQMPPAGSSALTAGDRLTLLYWIVCGGLDN